MSNELLQKAGVKFLKLSDFDDRIIKHRYPISIVLLYSNTCPHCVRAKKDFIRLKSDDDLKKLAIDCTDDNPLVNRVPYLFQFREEEFTVPQMYLVKYGKIVKKIKDLSKYGQLDGKKDHENEIHDRYDSKNKGCIVS
jgi:thiol-disulfide isomerase/thioredoxin